MTIHVQVINKDIRPGAIIRVTTMHDGQPALHVAPHDLDAGQGAMFMVHAHQYLAVTEVQQP